MKSIQYLILSFAAGLLFFMSACDTDDAGPNYTGDSVEYLIEERNDSGITGSVSFIEVEGGFTQINIQLNGTPVGGDHPTHIHFNSAAEGGDIAITLTNVNGTDGRSLSVIEETDSGERITYNELLNFDGHLNVHVNPQDLTVVAQADIGANALTGRFASYALTSQNNSGISGSVTFYERFDESALSVIEVDGTPADGTHPAHIHSNSASEGGEILISFDPVNGETGISRSQIEETDAGTAVTYTDILSFDAYVNVHRSSNDLTVVSQGNIGANASVQKNIGNELNY